LSPGGWKCTLRREGAIRGKKEEPEVPGGRERKDNRNRDRERKGKKESRWQQRKGPALPFLVEGKKKRISTEKKSLWEKKWVISER